MTAARTLHLYEHTEAVQQVEAWLLEADDELLESGGVLPPELEALLIESLGGFRQKVENVALVATQLEATAKALKDEIARLSSRKQTLENRAAWLRRYLFNNLEQAGQQKVEGVRVTVSLRAGAPKLEGELPAPVLRSLWQSPELHGLVRYTPETYELDRAAALAVLKTGAAIEGLSITRTASLQIK